MSFLRKCVPLPCPYLENTQIRTERQEIQTVHLKKKKIVWHIYSFIPKNTYGMVWNLVSEAEFDTHKTRLFKENLLYAVQNRENVYFTMMILYDYKCSMSWRFLIQPLFSVPFQTWHEPRHDKTNKMSVRPAKTQINLCIRPDWSESSLCAQWVAKDPSFLHADSEDSDQTGRMPRLIWVFTGRTVFFVGFVMRRLKYVQKRFRLIFIKWAASWQNQQNGMCAQRRLKSAWAPAQSEQRLHCSRDESLGP